MNFKRFFVVVAVAGALVGCGPDTLGLQNLTLDSGLLIDMYALKYQTPKNQNTQFRILYAYIAQVALVKIASELPINAVERRKIAQEFEDTNNKINDLLDCVYDDSGNPRDCLQFNTYMFVFYKNLGGIIAYIGKTKELGNFRDRWDQLTEAFKVAGIFAAGGASGGVITLSGLTASQFQPMWNYFATLFFDFFSAARSINALYKDFVLLEAKIIADQSDVYKDAWLTLIKNDDLETIKFNLKDFDAKNVNISFPHYAAVSVMMERACGELTEDLVAEAKCKLPPSKLKKCFPGETNTDQNPTTAKIKNSGFDEVKTSIESKKHKPGLGNVDNNNNNNNNEKCKVSTSQNQTATQPYPVFLSAL